MRLVSLINLMTWGRQRTWFTRRGIIIEGKKLITLEQRPVRRRRQQILWQTRSADIGIVIWCRYCRVLYTVSGLLLHEKHLTYYFISVLLLHHKWYSWNLRFATLLSGINFFVVFVRSVLSKNMYRFLQYQLGWEFSIESKLYKSKYLISLVLVSSKYLLV